MLKFDHREPIGSSTYPMPDQAFDEGAYRLAMRQPELRNRTATIYAHIPFCDQICKFCGFNKMQSPLDLKADYVDALIKEMDVSARTPWASSLQIDAVYVGGGTPNSLSPEQIYRITDKIRTSFPLTADCEVSVEGTPQNFTSERIDALLAGGVNRVSTGIQTFDGNIRREYLNMRNGREELLESLAAIDASFTSWNIDMIYNLTGQSEDIWHQDLETAIAAGSTHLTHYPLVLLENTTLYRDLIRKNGHPIPAQEMEIRMFEHTVERMRDSRFTNQYSVRDWAEPGHSCRYIELNARANHVLAFGAGAHGYAGGITYRSIAAPRRYVEAIESGRLALDAMRVATEDEMMRRFLVMGLRLKVFDTRPFAARFGRPVEDVFGDKIGTLVEAGFITFENAQIAFTPLGDIWANNVRTFFEGTKNRAVGYSNTLGAGESGKDHFTSISRVKAAADVETR